ncbi:MAG TPA: SRPBCC domain-containing protein [Kofleriaceae bacterium]|nr:SRPBCC domain-containing protein [Kofleriaceae bacterium]
MIEGDRVAVTVRVSVPPDVAFEVFTSEIDQWWRRGVRYRVAGRRPGTLVLEPGLGGRLFEQYDGPAGTRVHEAGRITAWQPPSHLAFEWRGSNFQPGEVTFVDVRFTATDSGGTEVALEHRGFAALRPDHPVRHGKPAEAFIRDLGSYWADLLTGLRVYLLR